MARPNKLELRYANDGLVEVGVDEAGRGCLWGRMYVGAVVFSDDPVGAFFDHGAGLAAVRDSKKLSPRRRAIVRDYIHETALDYSVAWVEPSEIDQYNVLQADLMAMHRALDALVAPVQRILVDGDAWRPWAPLVEDGRRAAQPVEAHLVVEGDGKYLPIAAASILAKTAHDDWVQEVVAAHPEWDAQYGLSRNMGYGTATHMQGLEQHGATPLHRASFAPVRNVLGRAAPPLAGGGHRQRAPKAQGWAGATSEVLP